MAAFTAAPTSSSTISLQSLNVKKVFFSGASQVAHHHAHHHGHHHHAH